MTVTSDERADPATETTETDQTVDLTETADGIAADVEEQAPGRRPWLRRVIVSALAVIFVAALGLSGFLGWTLWQEREVTRAGEQAQQAAVAYAQILTSIDSGRVDENFDQVLDGATGEFKDMYSQSSVQLRQLLIDNKASAHGVVVESAIQSASKDKVVVLLFVDQSVSNTNVPDPRMDRSRIKMTMEFVDGRWRASQVALP
jgi:Mce-associated membrane protein